MINHEVSEAPATASSAAVKSAARVLDVLEELSKTKTGLTFVELRDLLKLPKSSLHMLLSTMADRDYIAIDDASRKYRIGIRTWEAGQAFTRSRDLAAVAQPFLRAVRDELQETAQLSILDGLENIYIAKEDSDHPLQLVSDVGRRLPAHATGLGKTLLAFLEASELELRLDAAGPLSKYTDHTTTDRAALRRELSLIREKRYAVDDGEFTVGVFCVAVPVFDHSGTVSAAISCSMPKARLSNDSTVVEQILPVLNAQAQGLSRALGHRDQ